MPPLSWTVSCESSSVIWYDVPLTLPAVSVPHTGFSHPFVATVPPFRAFASILFFVFTQLVKEKKTEPLEYVSSHHFCKLRASNLFTANHAAT
jgi:hypothetical protein